MNTTDTAATADPAGTILGIILAGIIIGMYFLPWIVAALRGVARSGGIIIVNIFLGWTLLGWVIALAWAASAKTKAQERADMALLAAQFHAQGAGNVRPLGG